MKQIMFLTKLNCISLKNDQSKYQLNHKPKNMELISMYTINYQNIHIKSDQYALCK